MIKGEIAVQEGVEINRKGRDMGSTERLSISQAEHSSASKFGLRALRGNRLKLVHFSLKNGHALSAKRR